MRALYALAPVLLLAGCALLPSPSGSAARTASTQVIDAAPEAVWQVLPEVYSALALPIFEADSAAYLLASTRAINVWAPWLGPAEAPHARCTVPVLFRTLAAVAGTGIRDDRVPVSLPAGRVMLTVESRLDGAGAETRLQTRMILSPVSVWGTPGGVGEPYCVSTGRLEARIAEDIRSLLGKQVAPAA